MHYLCLATIGCTSAMQRTIHCILLRIAFGLHYLCTAKLYQCDSKQYKKYTIVAETKYIFVTGGVASSLGKGIISSSIGKLLQARGYNITIQKFDP